MQNLAIVDRPAPPAPHTALDATIIESVLLGGDLARLTADQRVSYYNRLCESLGLNPLTQPFKYINLQGTLKLYALKDATEQLRKIHGVSITELSSQRIDDVFVVTAKAADRDGRTDAATGAVALGTLKGEALANALMKAETKAKRRATLSICGLGMLDETETDTMGAPPLVVEAPKRVELPAGTVQILKATEARHGQASWAVVEYVDATGVVNTLPANPKERGAVELFSQLAQEAVPVVLEIGEGPRNHKPRIESVKRWKPVDENAVLDAEIAAAEPPAL